MAICYTIAAVMLVIGIGFFTGKAASYIKSYQDMEEKEKNNIKIGNLCKNISLLFFLAAFLFGIAGYSEWFRLEYFKGAMIGWIALCSADIVFINKSGRYVNQTAPVSKKSPMREAQK